MMKIGAVVIVYHPDTGLKERLLSYLPYVEKLFIFDNSENKDYRHLIDGLPSPEKISYYSECENKGLSTRLNQAAQMAILENFDWLLTMDQDSYFANDNFLNFLKCLENYTNTGNVAVFGVQYLHPNSQSSTCLASAINHLITSGSMLNLNLFRLIGNFDEALFIDQVDSEYCYRAILKGYEIIQFNNVYLQHSLGKQSTHRSFKSFKKTKRSLHSPLRLYYMTRNYFYIRAKYKESFPKEIEELKKDLLTRLKNNFLYSSQRFSLVQHVLRGIIDYKNNKMGKKT